MFQGGMMAFGSVVILAILLLWLAVKGFDDER